MYFLPNASASSASAFGVTPQKRKRREKARRVHTHSHHHEAAKVPTEGAGEAFVCGTLPREVESARALTHRSGCIDKSGWAWLCTDRQLLLWEHRDVASSEDQVTFVKDLPSTSGAEQVTARLVSVWQDKFKVRRPGVTVLSPGGVVYFWAEIESGRPPISLELPQEDEEVYVELLAIEDAGFLAATDKGSLFQILVRCNAVQSPRSN